VSTVSGLDASLPRQVIVTLVRQLRSNVVPLASKAVVPTHFVVYLHPDDHSQLAGIGPVIVEQAARAMDEEIARLSRWSGGGWRLFHRLLNPWASTPPLPIDAGGARRQIELLPDPDGDLPRGRFTVRTQLPAPAPLDFAGTATVSVTAGRRTSPGDNGSAPPPRAAYARLDFRDDEGAKTFEISDDKTLVGRGGQGVWVDVRLVSAPEISQEHVRIRRDPASGAFFLKDLSRNGTALDGRRLPAGVVYDGDEKREANPLADEVPLPAQAQITLAGILTLSFCRVP
jgi:hypothetical protein